MDKIKVTKKMLEDYRKTVREIPLLEEELAQMWNTDKGMDNSVILDYREGFPRPQSIVGFDQKRYDMRKRSLELKKARVAAVKEWIDCIEDGQTRCVFRMFYMDGMSWIKIAQKTGYGTNEGYPRKMIRDKYLQEKKIK